MTSPNPHPSTSLTRAINHLDPLSLSLSPPPPPQNPLLPSTDPLSFKRRTASQAKSIKSGLLGGLLRIDQREEDLVPTGSANYQFEVPSGGGGRARASSMALTFDSERNDDDDEDDDGQRTPTSILAGRWPGKGRPPGRISFSQPVLRDGRYSTSGMLSPGGMGGGRGPTSPRGEMTPPSITLVTTPLPIIPILVLCCAMFGEFLSASTSSPFLYFMIEDFGIGQGPGGGGEAAVGFYTGIVSSIFFLSQFLTSLLWVSAAERHGRRAVLFTSLMGNAISLVAFGTSKNLGTAICVRLTMGLFNGAVGVARSAVQSITDPSNESQAFTLMGLAWGLGGIVGSIIGGLAENPVRNHPYFFGDSVLFKEYPYLLPCLISGSITFVGSLLSLFLGPDGGPREGGIKLPTEKDVERAASSLIYLPMRVFSFVRSRLFSVRSPISLGETTVQEPSSSQPLSLQRADSGEDNQSVTSGANTKYGSAFNGFTPMSLRRSSKVTSGSAYGYDRPRRISGKSVFRPMSVGTSTRYAPDYEDLDPAELNFAQRLLLANEPAVFSLSELWVANATRNDETMSLLSHFEPPSDDPDPSESVFEHDDDDDEESRIGFDEEGEEPDFFGYGSAPPSMDDLRGAALRRQKEDDEDAGRGRYSTEVSSRSPVAPSLAVPRGGSSSRSPSRERERERDPPRVFSYGGASSSRGGLRRASVASSMRPQAIFANTGLDPSSLAGGMASPGLLGRGQEAPGESAFFNPMAAIPEGARAPSFVEVTTPTVEEGEEEEKPGPSLMMQLPLAMIAQYALVALHGTTCDQIFLSFLVTPIPSGGLGLKASDYAILIAAMFFFQTIWQFQFYPNVVAPRGPLTHLAMFRLGLALYIPVYLLFPELRGLLNEKSTAPTLWGMMVISAVRYLASTCAYTAVMVLINAMSPPHLVPLANGLAQSAVSLARFIGPILGGTIWSLSIVNGPNAHPWPFNYAAGFVFIGLLCALGFLHSFRIH